MSALALRIIACVAMLLDHIGSRFYIEELRIFGRIAFPVFVFLIYNGYRHTSNPFKYALRLGMFALLSQVPFALFCQYPSVLYNGNVFLTLLMALLCIWAGDVLARNRAGRWFCLLPAAAAYGLYAAGILHSDYGAKGILLGVVFWLFDGKALWKRAAVCVLALCAVYHSQILGCILSLFRGGGFAFSLSSWERTQIWSLLALPLIFAYNGEKGRVPGGKLAAKAAQIGFYTFYPAHMLVLWLISK